jgi:sulfur carrier protein
VKITVNDVPETCADGTTLADLLRRRGQATGVAVAVNGEFVARSGYATRLLREGDAVDVVAPMQGG